jgi:hypothetical protein
VGKVNRPMMDFDGLRVSFDRVVWDGQAVLGFGEINSSHG